MPPTDLRQIAFLAPMRSELRPLVRALSLRRTHVGDFDVYRGAVGDTEVVASLTTIGTVAAAEAAERLLHGFPSTDHVVVVGIAGGVGPNVGVGDLIVPEIVVDGATGREYRPAPLGAGTGAVRPSGKIWTSDEFVIDKTRLAGLEADGVVALDMETAAVAAVCEGHARAWSVFRAISDRADEHEDSSVLELARADGSPNLPAVARLLLRRPRYALRLARLGREAASAARTAASAAARALRDERSAERG
jgi:adenosylhomocysteine nucleosidase